MKRPAKERILTEKLRSLSKEDSITDFKKLYNLSQVSEFFLCHDL